MRIPPFLKAGDSIALIATARKISSSDLAPAISKLESWGLKVLKGRHLHDEFHQFAGDDMARAADLQWALDDPVIKAILVARGGYGTLRIIDRVNFKRFRTDPKWIIGYSDVTVLHSQLDREGFASMHATMPVNFHRHEPSTESLRQALFGEKIMHAASPHPLNRAGQASASLSGGNLSLLYALSGSASESDMTGKILFLEDLDEYLYHIDRMMMNLKRRGMLANLAGLVVGGMTEMKDNTIPFGQTAEEIIRSAVEEYNYPVCFGFPAGHGVENMALYFGVSATLSVDAGSTTLSFL